LSQWWLWAAIGASGAALFLRLAHQALRDFSRARLEKALERRGRLDRLRRLYEHHGPLGQATFLAYVLCLVLTTLSATAWGLGQFGPTWKGWMAAAAVAAGLSLTLGGVIPAAWARYAADAVLVHVLPILQVVRWGLRPLTAALAPLEGLTRRLLGVPRGARPHSHIEEEIRSVVMEGEREGVLLEDQKDMIENVIDLKKEDTSEIMTPRTDIVSVQAGASLPEARQLIAQSGFSRIPVCETNIDTIVGILYAKDLLQRLGRPDADRLRARDAMREPLFVPETKKLDELYAEFIAHKVHIAIVLDEYGGTAGLVTIEDVIEEIFGDITDEYEAERPKPIRRLGDRAFEVEARLRINEVNDELELDLPEGEDYETIGGFLLSRLGTIPKAGQTLDHDAVHMTVVEADERRIVRLRLELAPPTPPPDEGPRQE
jgi:CBS domain containing-hemolysin-like protein